MSRSQYYRRFSGSVSALAMVSFLGACSQPASHAAVDLSGSNSGGFQTAQTFNPHTGQPVYNPSAGFGPQSFPSNVQYQPNSQFAARSVPGNQVASLGNGSGGFDTFGILNQQQSAPQSFPVQSSPINRQQQLLSSPQFQQEAQNVNQAFEDSARLAVQAPFAEAESLGNVAPFEREANSLQVAPVETGSAARNSSRDVEDFAPRRRTSIEESKLEPIAPPKNRDVRSVQDDYATIRGPRARAADEAEETLAESRQRSRPWLAPQFGSQEGRTPRRRGIPRINRQAETPRENSGPDSDFTRAARDLLPERPRDARLPAPSAVGPACAT